MKAIFFGPNGVRAGWRFLAYAVVVTVLDVALQRLVVPFAVTALHIDQNGLNASGFIVV
jgi:hypothetical protein